MSEPLGLSALDAIQDPIAVLDQDGAIEAVNTAWRQFAWLNGADQGTTSPIGANYIRICEQAAGSANGEEGPLAAEGIRAVMDGRRVEFHLEYPCHSPHEQRWFRMTVTRLSGTPSKVVVSHRDITPIKRAEIAARLAQAMLRQAAEQDPLTDLPNRMLLMQQLETFIERRSTEPTFRFALLFLELDRYRLVNDALGHLAGDEMLIALGQRLREAETEDSFVARFGDHEFVYVASAIDGANEAGAIANGLRAVLSAPYTVHGHLLRSTVNIGIAMGDEASPQELLRRGTIALNEARQTGRGTTVVFDQTMHERLIRRLRIEVALRLALKRREFTLLYQPIVDIDSGRLMSVEAVLFWHHPEFGAVSAEEFMPIAEQMGAIGPIDEWALHESCKQWARWQQQDSVAAPALMNVTVSRVQIASGTALLGTVRSALEGAGMPAAALQIHMSERNVMMDPAGARRLLAGLRDLGVLVAMDDFGTGTCSLACLREYPFHTVTVDKSLIANIARDPRALAVARATIQGIENLGLVSVAEGIDEARVLVMLQAMGCSRGQGSLFARPMPPDRLMTQPESYD